MLAAVANSNQMACRNMLKVRESIVNPSGEDVSIFSSSRRTSAVVEMTRAEKSAKKIDPKPTKMQEFSKQTAELSQIKECFTRAVDQQGEFLLVEQEQLKQQKRLLETKETLNLEVLKKEKLSRLIMLKEAGCLTDEEFKSRAMSYLWFRFME